MPASVIVQVCLITSPALSLTTVISWSLLLGAMAVPYIFSGVVVSLALTRSPFPAGQVYGVDLLDAALGCLAVIGILNVVDAPTAVIISGALSGLSAVAFAASAGSEDQQALKSRAWWRRPMPVVGVLLTLVVRAGLLVWGAILVVYLLAMRQLLPILFQATTDQVRFVRIGISLAAILPLGFLLGFAFPTGMRLVEAVDTEPTPWFWGINGATGVLASALGVVISMSAGIDTAILVSGLCYLLLIPTSFALLRMAPSEAKFAMPAHAGLQEAGTNLQS